MSESRPVVVSRRVEDEAGVGAEPADQPGLAGGRGMVDAGGQGRTWCGSGQRQGAGDARPGGQPGAGHGGVDRVLGHGPVRRQLAADDGDHAVAADHGGVAAGEIGGAVVACVEEGPQPGEGTDHVAAAYRTGERRRHHVEQEPDLHLGGLRDVRNGPVDGFVGEADVEGAVGLREDQNEPVGLPGDRGEHRHVQPGQRRAPQHQVGAPGGPQPDVVDQVTRPDPGGVDDGASGDGVGLPGQLVAEECVATVDPHRPRVGCARPRRGRRRCARWW